MRRTAAFVLALLAALTFISLAQAQQPVVIIQCTDVAGSSPPRRSCIEVNEDSPLNVRSGGSLASTNTQAGSTIAVTNTFQTAIAANATRTGCLVQNQSSRTQYVYFGTVAAASLAASWQVPAGGSISCNAPGVVISTAVAITGTATDAYVAGEQ